MRILVAEDDAFSRRYLTGVLRKLGHEVVLTCDGQQAWDALNEKSPPKVALLDWVMPKMSGIDVCKRLRQDKERPYTYIILITGKDQKDDIIYGLDSGADDYLTKPTDVPTLRSRLKVAQRIVNYHNELIRVRKNLQTQMDIDNAKLYSRLEFALDNMEQSKIFLEVASSVQNKLIPNLIDEKTMSGITMAGCFKPAYFCGGDWWNYFQLKDGSLLFIIGDVTGHGVDSTIIAATAQGAASSFILRSNGVIDLEKFLQNINLIFLDYAKSKYLMTCFIALYEPKHRVMRYSSAGHPFPYMYSQKNNSTHSLISHGNILGHQHLSSFPVHQISLDPDDTLFFYTDGLTECVNSKKRSYGDRRLFRVFKKYATYSAVQLRDEVLSDAFRFFENMPLNDDISFVVWKVNE